MIPCVVVVAAVGLLSVIAAWAADPAARPRVTVSFTTPERFTDLKSRCLATVHDVDALVRELEAFITETAVPRVPEGATLAITIVDVDMAGEFEGPRGAQFCEVRTVREAYPPRVRLSFRLTDREGRVREGTRDLHDPNFLLRAGRVDRDPLRYEKELLRDWIRKEFGS
jgi:hypothetical protein